MQQPILPFFVQYSELVTILHIAVVAIFAALSIAMLWWFRRRKATRLTKSLLDEIGPVTAKKNLVRGKRAVMEGVLASNLDPDTENIPAPHPTISHIYRRRRRPRYRTSRRDSMHSVRKVPAYVGLRALGEELVRGIDRGTRVRVAGTLVAHAGTSRESASYRDEAITWRLEGSDETQLTIVSCDTTRPKLRKTPMLWAALSGFPCLALAVRCAGPMAISSVKKMELQVENGQIEYPFSIQLAAALPHYRTLALERLERELWWPYQQLVDVGTAHMIALESKVGDCVGAARIAKERNQLRWAADRIETCSDSMRFTQNLDTYSGRLSLS